MSNSGWLYRRFKIHFDSLFYLLCASSLYTRLAFLCSISSIVSDLSLSSKRLRVLALFLGRRATLSRRSSLELTAREVLVEVCFLLDQLVLLLGHLYPVLRS